jgi:hypothetical protein
MDRVSVLPNERIDITDYEDGPGGRLVESDQVRRGRVFFASQNRGTPDFTLSQSAARILGTSRAHDTGAATGNLDFAFNAITFGVDSSAVLNRGRGWLPYLNDANQLQFGYLLGDEGTPTLTLDFSGAPASSTQAVYIRATGTQADFQNRIFWNPGGAVEFVDNVSTRRVAGWEAIFQEQSVAPPGNGEWVRIWLVTLDGASKIASITDRRHFYFEGQAATTYAAEWGGGNDRNVDRAKYGVQDQHLFVQAVRSQLADTIGAGGWYKALPTNITKMFRNVTVDTPGGPGGDGDYATINAAITALTAFDGGTILLKPGTYDITAGNTCSRRINLVAVAGGVFLNNRVNANTFMFTYNSTQANGSYWEGITVIDHATESSEKVLKVDGMGANHVQLRNCQITGEVWVSASTFYADGCRLADAFQTHNYSDTTLRFSGARVRAEFTRCLITGGTNLAGPVRVDTVLITGVLNGADGSRSTIVFDGVTTIVQNTATRSVHLAVATSTICDVEWDGCHWFVNPPDSSTRCLTVNAGNCTFKACSLKVNNSGDPFNNAVFYANPTLVTDQVNVDGFEFDFNTITHNMPAFDQVGLVFAGRRTKVRGMHARNILLPDSTITSVQNCFVLCNPDGGGLVEVLGSAFSNVTNSAANHQHVHLIGQPTLAAGAGRIHINDTSFDTSSIVFRSTTSVGSVIYIDGAARNHEIMDNVMYGGCWARAIYCLRGGINCSRNELSYPTVSVGFAQFIRLLGPGTTFVNDGYCIAHDNFVFHDNVTGTLSYIEISNFGMATVHNNVDMDIGAGVPASTFGIYVHDILNLTIHGNNSYDTTGTTAITTQIPAVTATQNI